MRLSVKELLEKLSANESSLPVLVRDHNAIYFAFEFCPSEPMVRAGLTGAGVFVRGRANAKRYACIETNVAFYPSITQARRDALTVGQLRALLASRPEIEDSEVLVRSGSIKEDPAYRSVNWVSCSRAATKGRPEFVTRGGEQALVLSTL